MGDNPDAKKEVNLLDLPWFILDKILLKLSHIPGGYFALENLAEASPNFIPAIRRTPMALTNFNLKIDKNSAEFVYRKHEETLATREFLFKRSRDPFLLEEVELCGMIFHNFYRQNEGDPFERVNAAVRRSSALFGKPFGIVHIDLNHIPLTAAPWLLPFDSCETITFEGSKPIPNDVLKTLLTTCNASKDLSVYVPIRDDFYMDLTELKSELLVINPTKCVTRRYIQRIPNKFAVFIRPPLGARDIESFIAHWYRSTDTKNHGILFALNIPREDLRLEKFRPMVFDAQRRGPNFPGFSSENKDHATRCNLPDCVDIERPDGLLATVIFRYKMVNFVVWYDRFPDTTGMSLDNYEN